MKILSNGLAVGLAVLAVYLMVGCTSIKETGQLGHYGYKNDLYDVTRIEHIPDPIRMQVTVVTKFQCTAKRDQPEAGQSHYTGCTQIMYPQTFTQPGWLVSLLQPAMIAAGIWAAGHEVGGMDADQTTVNQQAKLNASAKQKVIVPRGKH